MQLCPICKTPHHNPKYCSRVCSNKADRSRHKPRVKGHCKICDNPVPSRIQYCSDDCRAIARTRRPVVARDASKAVKDFRLRRKQKMVDYKGGKCSVCGYDRCLTALDFHHRDPAEKDFGLSKHNANWELVKSELDKCEILCANCHREVHAGLIDLLNL